jgi:uncharacterized protein YjbJ (UPF0337 family)
LRQRSRAKRGACALKIALARDLLHLPISVRADGARKPTAEDSTMNWDRVQGNWKQFKGQVQQKWGKLTDDQFAAIDGQREILAGKIQEAYGIGKDEADRQIQELANSLQDGQNHGDASAHRLNARH